MSINVQKKLSLFSPENSIKYLTGWDNLFKKEKNSGRLKFYNLSNPVYLIDVQILADRDKLREEDITVILGEYHNSRRTEELINEKTSEIYNYCKSSIAMKFVLDLNKMITVTEESFVGDFPIYGMNTLFMFENIPGKIYCLVNPAKNITDSDFYTWFVSYIYSTYICLTTNNKIEDYAKKFLQAISSLSSTNGKKANVVDKATILDCGLGDNGEVLLPVPGENTKRFEELFLKSVEQMTERKNKKK